MTKSNPRPYELFLILTPKKDDAATQAVIRDVETILNKFDAKIIANQGGNSSKLAYAIDKRKESYQLVLEIEALPSSIAEIRKQLALVEDLLRLNIAALVPN